MRCGGAVIVHLRLAAGGNAPGERQRSGPAALAGFILRGGEFRQQHAAVYKSRRHHAAQGSRPLDALHGLHHPGGPAGPVADIAFHHGQDDLVRLVPGPVDPDLPYGKPPVFNDEWLVYSD